MYLLVQQKYRHHTIQRSHISVIIQRSKVMQQLEGFYDDFQCRPIYAVKSALDPVYCVSYNKLEIVVCGRTYLDDQFA